ncbi:hypothetical protein HNQ35_000464 [Cerasibacillus quisquiliarum]|uniref:Uncharacterized protein n=1 Tax=Cerasibacillus quisquiliarum TaxID=227865 RepID=A0A511UTC3_9BACI|nr:hypothetical protein [Cerasibacillus quisquiliarum]MBB5145275.1 hypothetical protein [Cerasibacillus quisquiliarum]GEN29834.1 hypothetical protein CQU01_00720 [Cerasibacillus quisquiliarum]
MYFLLFTVIYCLITQILNIDYVLALGIYLIGLCFIKGMLKEMTNGEGIKDVFNIKKTKHMYEENGFKNSLIEYLSLFLVFLNSYLIDYEPFTPFEYIYMFFLIGFVYRFIFWGMIRSFKEADFRNLEK